MARAVETINIQCTSCGHAGSLRQADLAVAVEDEVVTLANINQVIPKLVCKSCRQKLFRIEDGAARCLVDPEHGRRCEGCDCPIILPRLEVAPDSRLCQFCVDAGTEPDVESEWPRPPADMSRCPRCLERHAEKSATFVRENSKNGSLFIGCSNFPRCNWTAPFSPPNT